MVVKHFGLIYRCSIRPAASKFEHPQAATLKPIKIIGVMLVLTIHILVHGGTAAPDYQIKFRPWIKPANTARLYSYIACYIHVDEKFNKLCDSATE